MADRDERVPESPSLEGIARQWGGDSPLIGIQRISLDTAFTNREFPVTGNWLYVVEASSTSARASIEFNEQRGDKFPLLAGLFLAGVAFHTWWIENTAQANQWLDVIYGVETQENIRIINPRAMVAAFELTKGDGFTVATNHTAGVAAALVIAAAANRREVILQSDSANTNIIYIGHDNTVVAGAGLRLDAGQSLILSTSQEIWSIASAGAPTLRVADIRDN